MSNNSSPYIRFAKQVMKPALGCTDPICAAYASAEAATLLGQQPEKIEILISSNLFKNAMDVFVPGTGKVGLPIASACGALAGKPELKLQCLQGIEKDQVEGAQDFVDGGNVAITVKSDSAPIYCKALVTAKDQSAEVLIEGGYTQIVRKTLNGKVVFEEQDTTESSGNAAAVDPKDFSIADIFEFSKACDFDEISFMLEARDLNKALSEEGLSNPYGLQVGRSMTAENANLSESVVSRSAAASDARMGGCTLPAMSNYGSGNQGIAATMPVVVAAEELGVDDEKLARALFMSHVGAAYIKSHYPPLSAFCGNSATCAAGAAAIVYLMDGSFEQQCFALNLVLSDVSGMVCDGAKATCALKVGSAAGSAIRAATIAMKNTSPITMGIITDEVETTIKNLGRLVNQGMAETDRTIFSVMAERAK